MTPGSLLAVQRGLLQLDAPITTYVPEPIARRRDCSAISPKRRCGV